MDHISLLMRTRKDQAPSAVQTLIFSKEKFKTRSSVVSWLKDHDMKFGNIEETEQSWRARQRPITDFQEGSFRTMEIDKGIQAVIGRQRG